MFFFNFHLLPNIHSPDSRQRPATHIVTTSIRKFSARYVLDFFCAKKFKYLSRRCWWKSSYVSTDTSFCCFVTISCYVWKHSYPSVLLCIYFILFYRENHHECVTSFRTTECTNQTAFFFVDKKNQLDVTFYILYFSSNSCSTCFGQPCAHHQELRLRDVIVLCWSYGRTTCQPDLSTLLQPRHIPTKGYNITQSSPPDDGHMVARNMLSNY